MSSIGMIPEDCPVQDARLVEVHFDHYDFDGNIVNGTMVVFDVIADNVKDIFSQLLEMKFPIHKAVPISHYDGSDEGSMNDNNSSAFNGRKILGTSRWSSHAYGMAIDINPLQNPYLTILDDEIRLYPAGGFSFLNRELKVSGMVTGDVVEIFRSNHFTVWGGHWNDQRIDYHHFQLPWEIINNIYNLPLDEGVAFLSRS